MAAKSRKAAVVHRKMNSVAQVFTHLVTIRHQRTRNESCREVQPPTGTHLVGHFVSLRGKSFQNEAGWGVGWKVEAEPTGLNGNRPAKRFAA